MISDAELDAIERTLRCRTAGAISIETRQGSLRAIAAVRALRAEMREVDRILADAEMANEVDYTFDLIGEARRTLKREAVKP